MEFSVVQSTVQTSRGMYMYNLTACYYIRVEYWNDEESEWSSRCADRGEIKIAYYKVVCRPFLSCFKYKINRISIKHVR